MNTYNEYKIIKQKQDDIVNKISDKLQTYPKGSMGLILDKSPEYIKDKNEFNKEFKKLQAINQYGSRNFKKEIRKEFEEKRKMYLR